MKIRSAIQTQSGTSSAAPRSIAWGRWRCPSTIPGRTSQPFRSRTSSSGRAARTSADLPTAAIVVPSTATAASVRIRRSGSIVKIVQLS
jgi:hypothetical protein